MSILDFTTGAIPQSGEEIDNIRQVYGEIVRCVKCGRLGVVAEPGFVPSTSDLHWEMLTPPKSKKIEGQVVTTRTYAAFKELERRVVHIFAKRGDRWCEVDRCFTPLDEVGQAHAMMTNDWIVESERRYLYTLPEGDLVLVEWIRPATSRRSKYFYWVGTSGIRITKQAYQRFLAENNKQGQ